MKKPPRALAMAAVALSPLVLAGCEKPAPGVTVWSGTNSEHTEALCWQFEEAALTPRECAQEVLDQAAAGQGIATIEAAPGDVIGIAVDPVVADGGWSLQIGGETLAAGMTGTYHRFTLPDTVASGGPGFTMQVIAAAQPTGNRGYWFFQILPR